MANEWLRLWHDMPTDPKWRTIARHSKQPISLVQAVYLHLLVDASRNVTRGHVTVTNEDLASALDCDEEQISAILDAMEGRVIQEKYLSGWDSRQPKKEDSGNEQTGAKSAAERKAEERARKKALAEQLAKSQEVTESHDLSRNVTTDKDKDKEEDKEKDKNTHTGEPRVAGAVCVALRSEGMAQVNPSHPELLALLDQGARIEDFISAGRIAKERNKGFAYVLGIVKGQLADAKRMAEEAANATPTTPRKAKEPAWWISEQSINAKAASLGLRARPGEDMANFKARIEEAIRKSQGGEAA